MAVLYRKLLLLTLLLIPSSLLAAEDFIRSYDELVTYLKTNPDNAEMHVDKASSMVVVPSVKGAYKGAHIILWHKKSGVVHFMESLKFVVPKERLPDVESAFLRLNHSMKIAGLGINYINNRVYFRTSVPLTLHGGLSKKEIQHYHELILDEAIKVLPTVKAVIDNKVKPEQAVKYYSASSKESVRKRTIIVGTYTKKMGGSTWDLVISKIAKIKLYRDGKLGVESQMSLDKNKVTFNDKGGPLAEKEAGIYEWSYNKEELVFKKVMDTSKGRAAVLTTGNWILKENEK